MPKGRFRGQRPVWRIARVRKLVMAVVVMASVSPVAVLAEQSQQAGSKDAVYEELNFSMRRLSASDRIRSTLSGTKNSSARRSPAC